MIKETHVHIVFGQLHSNPQPAPLLSSCVVAVLIRTLELISEVESASELVAVFETIVNCEDGLKFMLRLILTMTLSPAYYYSIFPTIVWQPVPSKVTYIKTYHRVQYLRMLALHDHGFSY